MLSKIVAGLLIAMLCVVGLAGCVKEEPAPAPEQTKTSAEYEAEAEKEITDENMADELDKIEKTVEEDAAQE